MSWLRIDDRESLDSRVARLTDAEYRERMALMQYVSREHGGAGGIFSADEIAAAALATPRGARSVSQRTLTRLLELDLLRRVDAYSEDELRTLEEGERTNRRHAYQDAARAIRDARDEDGALLRFNRWEHYNGAGDRTAAERKARQRARMRGDIPFVSRVPSRVPVREGHGEGHGTGTASVHAQPVQSPKSVSSTPTSNVDVALAREAAPQAGEGLETGRELLVSQLLALLPTLDEARTDYVRGGCGRLPESVTAGLIELLHGSTVRDGQAYVLGTIRRELEARGLA